MKITRRAARHIDLILAIRRAEKMTAKPKLNYDHLFDGITHIVPNV